MKLIAQCPSLKYFIVSPNMCVDYLYEFPNIRVEKYNVNVDPSIPENILM
jgi:hypothetical protein